MCHAPAMGKPRGATLSPALSPLHNAVIELLQVTACPRPCATGCSARRTENRTSQQPRPIGGVTAAQQCRCELSPGAAGLELPGAGLARARGWPGTEP